MTLHTKQLLSLSLFALGIFISNAEQAQSCTPTLYLFRHAEDVPDVFPTRLTPAGQKHASLYPAMIDQLAGTLGHCDVKRVFATWDRNKTGTTNPYYTALPLAQAKGLQVEMTFEDPNYPAPGTHKYYLCEYPIEDNRNPQTCEHVAGIDPKHPELAHRNALAAYGDVGDVKSHLYSYLLPYFNTPESTTSVAIFHTSQGMPALSGALDGTTYNAFPVVVNCGWGAFSTCKQVVPPSSNPYCPFPVSEATNTKNATCYKEEDQLLSWPGIKRSSVNIFYFFSKQYISVVNDKPLYNYLHVLKFYQCFNLDNYNKSISIEYFCPSSGSIGKENNGETDIPGLDKLLPQLLGKICYEPNISANVGKTTDTFGHCL
jgi:hypothetical protein